jgi:hypothetical protein
VAHWYPPQKRTETFSNSPRPERLESDLAILLLVASYVLPPNGLKVMIKHTLLMCTLLISCADPAPPATPKIRWLQCSLMTAADYGSMINYTETYIIDFDKEKLYYYDPGNKEIVGPLKNVSFWPQMINQNSESATDQWSLNHVLRVNLNTMEIVDRNDSIGTGYNSGSSTHDSMGGVCKWINPLEVRSTRPY